MKSIWLILIGMALFNGFLLAFTPVFSQSYYSSGLYAVTDVKNESSITRYSSPGTNVAEILISFVTPNILGLLAGIGFAAITHSTQYFAVFAIAGFVTSLWTATSASLHGILSLVQNPIINTIYTLIAVAIGLVVAILLLGIFAQQDQD